MQETQETRIQSLGQEDPLEEKTPIPVHFSSLIPKMSMFTLAISYLTTSNLHAVTILAISLVNINRLT